MKKYSIFVLLLFLTIASMAQDIPTAEPLDDEEEKEVPVLFEKPKPAWKSNLHYGGNLWLGFFGAFYIDASPMVGYDISGKGSILGVGASFIYQGQYRQSGALSYGGRLFLRQAVYRSIFAQGEFEVMNSNIENFYNPKDTKAGTRQWGGAPLIGAGFYQGRTRQQRGSFISVMYNLSAPVRGFISPQGIGGNDSPFIFRIGYFF